MLRKWIIQTLAVMILAYFIPGIEVVNWIYAAVTAVVLGLLNSIVKPVLIILTLPVSVITLGLFLLVVNGIVVYIADYFVPGFTVHSLLAAILFSIGLSVLTSIMDDKKE